MLTKFKTLLMKCKHTVIKDKIVYFGYSKMFTPEYEAQSHQIYCNPGCFCHYRDYYRPDILVAKGMEPQGKAI